jgi:YD repeat-containing protein
VYDAVGNLVREVDQAGGVISTEYGPFAKPVARTGQDGVRYTFAFDTELRLTAVTGTGRASATRVSTTSPVTTGSARGSHPETTPDEVRRHR